MRTPLLICLLLMTLPGISQSGLSNQWESLIHQKKYTQAEHLCGSWAHSAKLEVQVEAQKCLANLALCKGQQINLMGNDEGGGTLGEGYTPKAVDEALKHLNEGLKLAPNDLSIHQGRLHILEVSGRFDAMANALDESASMMSGKDVVQDWLPYTAELADMGQFAAGLKLCQILDKRYPDSHDVVGNIGAFYNIMNQPDKSLPYLQRSVALAPSDPTDNWNLGRAYDFLNENNLADRWYSKAISIDPEGKNTPDRNCIYAQFVESKLHDRDKACRLQRVSCEANRQTACGAEKPAQQTPPS